MREVEASGKTVDEAVARALAQLGVGRDDVEIEVLSEGKPGGFLGIGGGDARVLVSISGNRAEPLAAPGPGAPLEGAQLDEVDEDDDDEYEDDDDEYEDDDEEEGELVAVPQRPLITRSAAAGDGGVVDTAEDVVADLLRLMGLRASLERYDMPNPMDPEGPIISVVDIQGDDLGVLIGRRGDTLEALQYIVNLIVSKKRGERTAVEIDVEGYRARRIQSLRQLAERMADRVTEMDRPFALEPMSPRDRRIVHITLQERTDVVTESEGEGETRKVVIHPK